MGIRLLFSFYYCLGELVKGGGVKCSLVFYLILENCLSICEYVFILNIVKEKELKFF